MSTILLAILAAAVGTAIGYYVSTNRAKGKHENAANKADKLLRDAEAKAKETVLAAQDESLKIKESGKREETEHREQLKAAESRVAKREEKLDDKEKTLDEQKAGLEKDRAVVSKSREEIEEIKQRQLANLEKVAKLKPDKAKEVLLQMVEKEFGDQMAAKVRQMETDATEQGEEKARKIIATAVQRYASEQASEFTASAIPIPSEEIKGRVIGKEGRNIQSFEKATGVDVIVDDSPDTIVISSFDPVRRQVARMSMEKLVADGRINPSRIEEVVAKAQKEVAQVTKKAGEDALFELKLTGIHPDLVKLLGTMKYRTSYGQNILRHSVEVSFIAEMLASELGIDTKKAKLAALFHDIGKAVTHEVEGPHAMIGHDIGKAVTHEVEGPHAMIGHDICKKYGLPEDVCHAVGAHHEDLPIESPLDMITQAADAISGARPGARRESFEAYVKRLTDLENVATSFDGVEKAYAIQAGREIRILVRPQEIDDLSTARLAKDVAAKVEKEMTYPGQIKVNVIRETRATELAK